MNGEGLALVTDRTELDTCH